MSEWTLVATLQVPGIPKAQPRKSPYLDKKTGIPRVRMNGSAEWWKSQIADTAEDHRPSPPFDEPVRVDAAFYFPRPKRLMRRRDPDGPVLHTAKPDRDNLDKAVLDTLKGIGFLRDDSIVCSGWLQKFYHAKTGRPGAVIKIYTLRNDQLTLPDGPA